MKTLKKVTIEPVFTKGEDSLPSFIESNKIYISEHYGSSRHLCLCGCEKLVIMPIDDGNKWWRLVKEDNGTISFIGSVGNYNFPCKSHYIITKNVANFV